MKQFGKRIVLFALAFLLVFSSVAFTEGVAPADEPVPIEEPAPVIDDSTSEPPAPADEPTPEEDYVIPDTGEASADGEMELPQGELAVAQEESPVAQLGAADDFDALLAVATADGAAAAGMVNALVGDAFLDALRAVLNYYYSVDSAQLGAFLAALDERGLEVAQSYEMAKIERESVDLEYIPGEMLVVFSGEVPPEIMRQTAEDTGATDVSEIDTPLDQTVAKVEISLEYTVDQAVSAMESDPAVEYAQPNYLYTLAGGYPYETIEEEVEIIEEVQDGGQAAVPEEYYPEDGIDVAPEVELQSTPNDTYYYRQWYFDKIRAGDAWDMLAKLSGRSKVRVAVIDAAPDITHPDIRSNMNVSLARDTSSGHISSYPSYGYHDHGTHVASTIASAANNSRGVAGVGSGSRNQVIELIPINAFDGEYASTASVVAALDWAIRTNCRVANLSLGGYGYDALEEAAINRATSNNVACVCAAGNDATSRLHTPSDYDASIAVMATTNYYYAGSRCDASFSNFGSAKDISAPGVNIYAATRGNNYKYLDGTSMASPIVAGVAAMVIYARPSLDVPKLKNVLYKTATDLYTRGYDIYTGWGNVDAAAAVARVVLTAPKNLKTTSPAYNKIKLSWSKVSAASGYMVYRATSKNGTYSLVKTTTGTSFTDTGRVTGKMYYYKVISYASTGGGKVKGATSSPKGGKAALSTPTGRKAFSASYRSIKVTWNKVSGATGYYIYRSSSKNGTYKLIKTNTGNASTSYTNTGLSVGKQYYYKIVAFRKAGGVTAKSAGSQPASARPVVSAPRNLTATRTASKQIQLKWTKPAGASGYLVYRATSRNGTYKLIRTLTSGSSTSYTIKGLTAGRTYYFKLIPYKNTLSGKLRGKSAGPVSAAA